MKSTKTCNKNSSCQLSRTIQPVNVRAKGLIAPEGSPRFPEELSSAHRKKKDVTLGSQKGHSGIGKVALLFGDMISAAVL